jgi:hypothetical protein
VRAAQCGRPAREASSSRPASCHELPERPRRFARRAPRHEAHDPCLPSARASSRVRRKRRQTWTNCRRGKPYGLARAIIFCTKSPFSRGDGRMPSGVNWRRSASAADAAPKNSRSRRQPHGPAAEHERRQCALSNRRLARSLFGVTSIEASRTGPAPKTSSETQPHAS